MRLFFDTETTGLPPSSHIVQLAALLTDDDGTTRGSCNFIIKPDGYEIPEFVAKIHGITTEIANRCGVPIKTAMSAFNNFAAQCQMGKIIAHNAQFDIRMIRTTYAREGVPSRLEGIEVFCTMEAMKDKVKMPPTAKMRAAGFNEFKAPKLEEAYQFAFQKPLENAHDALFDVLACKDLYFWLHPPQQILPPTSPELPPLNTQLDESQKN